jgi:hypothetical protein
MLKRSRLTEFWADSIPGQDAVATRNLPCREPNRGRPARSLVAILTELLRLPVYLWNGLNSSMTIFYLVRALCSRIIFVVTSENDESKNRAVHDRKV